MNIQFAIATESDAEAIAKVVIKLTEEICLETSAVFFRLMWKELLSGVTN